MAQAEDLSRMRKRRRTIRGLVTKLFTKIDEALEDVDGGDLRKFKQFEIDLKEKQGKLKELDENILESLYDAEENDETCDEEAESASEIMEKVLFRLVCLEKALDDRSSSKGSTPIERSVSQESVLSSGSKFGEAHAAQALNSYNVRVKLPKISLQKFSGRAQDWQEFWDSFKSAIHDSPALAKVDKFKYLKSYLEEPVRKVIGGLSLTDADYDSAIDILKSRFAKPTVIKRAHINELLNLSPVFNEKNTPRMRQLHDDIETNFRSLEALGVDRDSYSSIVVPVLLEKIPEAVRLNMFRIGSNHLEWSIEDLLHAFAKELEIRESHVPVLKGISYSANPQRGDRPRPQHHTERVSTASALFMGKDNCNKCQFCLESHEAANCTRYVHPEERKSVLMKFSRCFLCLNKGHRSFQCKSKFRCKYCKGRHHYLLCQDKEPTVKEAQPSNIPPPLNPNASTWVGLGTTSASGAKERVALQTALAAVEGKEGSRVRVLYDSGSQKTFVTEKTVARLKLEPLREEKLGVKTFGSSEPEIAMRKVYGIPLVPLSGGKSILIEAFMIDEISTVANYHIDVINNAYPHLMNIEFSDFSDEDYLEIDVLIGANYLWSFQDGHVIRGGRNQPVAIETALGWVISGPLEGKNSDHSSFVNSVCHVIDPFPLPDKNASDVDKNMHKLWDLDTLGIRVEDEVHKSVIDNISFTGTRYSVGLPWKVGHGPVPDNYNNAFVRLKSQVKKLEKSPQVFEEYHNIIKEQEKAGIIEQVSDSNLSSKVSYLPHRAVIRSDAETTKVRIVYDASCSDRKTGVSLNDCLHVGPPLTPLMFDMLIRFREKPIVLVGDIEKAFLNIEVDPTDRDVLRFLWIKDINAENPEIVTYRFNRVVFGVNSSPFLLNAVLQFHINRYREIDPKFGECMSKGFFVDDLVTTHTDVNEAFSLFMKAKERMSEGGFKLRKWKTNDRSLAYKINEDEVESKTGTKLARNEDSSKTKVLGLAWDKDQDLLEFNLDKVAEGEGLVTKRYILSRIAALFDPLGLISPVTVTAKVLFQDLCLEKLGWDDPLPKDKLLRWEKWLKGLKDMQVITTPRCMLDGLEGQILKTSLHGFGDASKKAYCATVYLVCETTEGIYSKLISSKTRIAPLKSLTIPRLELMAARILVNLIDTVKKALSSDTKIDEVKYWTDSIAVLYWIQNKCDWKPFVQHRVNEILTQSRKEDWGHVVGLENPADIGSRGASPSQLVGNNLWWGGPNWLKGEKESWPQALPVEESIEVKEEMKGQVVLTSTVESINTVGSVIDINRHSSLGKLLRVTAFVKRFISNLKRKKEGAVVITENLDAEDIQNAEKEWIKDAQVYLMGQSEYLKYKEQLGVVSNGEFLVCQGRMEFSDLVETAKKPILLPKGHKFTDFVISDCHERVHHCKEKSTLAELRTRFWVPKGRQYVKRVIRNCFICKRLEGRPFNAPQIAPLPSFRVTEAPPFSRIGVDFAGPLFCKTSNNQTMKVYIVLYTCCVTRAIHLDLVHSLDASTFLNSFRRFTSRRGTPTLVVSDNAKNFKATASLLRKFFMNESVTNFMRSRRISWRFNLPRCPWAGGMFERMVQSVKRCLRKVLGNARLTSEELHTVIVEIECTLNSRPLTYQYETEEVLTPSHLLYGHRLSPFALQMSLDIHNSEINDSKLIKRFLFLQKKLAHFWNRWKSEYLADLREQHKLSKTYSNSISEGDFVLVQDEQTKRGQWKMGIIQSFIKGRDGNIRGVNIRMSGKGKSHLCTRPLQKVFPLEISCSKDTDKKEGKAENKDVDKEVREEGTEGNVAEENIDLENVRNRGVYPKRAAARDAQWKTRLMLDQW